MFHFSVNITILPMLIEFSLWYITWKMCIRGIRCSDTD